MPDNSHDGRTVNWRERITVFLAFLTSTECLTVCKRQSRPEELAAALTRIWFDDLYIPGDAYMDTLKNPHSQRELNAFNDCFSGEELESLARFHGFFELRLNFVTNRQMGKGFFPENDSWQSILKHATYLLAELAPNPDHIRSTLESLAKQPTPVLLNNLQGTRADG